MACFGFQYISDNSVNITPLSDKNNKIINDANALNIPVINISHKILDGLLYNYEIHLVSSQVFNKDIYNNNIYNNNIYKNNIYKNNKYLEHKLVIVDTMGKFYMHCPIDEDTAIDYKMQLQN